MISYSLKCKIAVVGDVSTGKSSLINRFVENNFSEQYNKTIAPSIKTKKIKVPVEKLMNQTTVVDPTATNSSSYNIVKKDTLEATFDGQKKIDPKTEVEVFIMDAPGDIPEKDLAPSLRDIAAFIVVFDVSRVETYKRVEYWAKLCMSSSAAEPNSKPKIGVLVANKVDKVVSEGISSESVLNLAKKLGMEVYNMSALEGEEPELPFEVIAEKFHQKYEQQVENLKFLG